MSAIALPGRITDLSGQRFGRLVAAYPISIRRNGHVVFHCVCDCGGTTPVTNSNLKSKHTQSCGCLCREATSAANKTHGRSHTKIYRVWTQMYQRCYEAYAPNFAFYGGRGIRVAERWHTFENFLADMGEPEPGLTLDRIDPNGPYSPENCRWADRKTQARNTRRNRHITYGGRTQLLTDWERELGLGKDVLGKRLRRGWSIERAFSHNKRGSSQ